jgi:hypothetical protein
VKEVIPPKTGIDRFVGMKWEKAKKYLKGNAHLLVLGDKPSKAALDVAKSYRDTGLKCAMAVLCSHLYLKKHGAGATAAMAIKIYRELAERALWSKSNKFKRRAETLQHELGNLESMLCLSYYGASNPPAFWPLKPEFRIRSERGGLANIMLCCAFRVLCDEGTASQVAAMGIQRFLEKGMKYNSTKGLPS